MSGSGPPLPSRRTGLLARGLVLVVLFALAAYYFYNHDLRPSVDAARRADPWLLLLVAIVGNGSIVLIKARRAQVLVAPIARIRAGRLAVFFLGSYAADNLVMSQAGMGLRVTLIHREGVPLASAIAIEGLQKLLEGVWLVPFVILALYAHLPPPLSGPLTDGLYVAGAATLVLLVVLLLRPTDADPESTGVLQRARRWLRPVAVAASAIRDPIAALEVMTHTFIAWVIETLMVLCTFVAIGLPADLPTASLVMVVVNIAAVLPGLPGNLGTFEAAGTLALSAAGVDHSSALAFMILFHALRTIPSILVGLPVLRHVGVRALSSLPNASS